MYSRSEASRLKHEFWIAFGKYISLHPNSEGMKINWVNYHTGYKHVYFRMEASNDSASISIQLAHPDTTVRQLFYERFLGFRNIIADALGEDWTWIPEQTDSQGKMISFIGRTLKDVSVYDRSSWPDIISFLKPRIIALDEVWNNIKDGFEDLR